MKVQYAFIKQSREILLGYCMDVSTHDFVRENTKFGRGSIRNLFVHIANVYEYWIGQQALKKELLFSSYESKREINDIIHLFHKVDLLVEEFVDHTEMENVKGITCYIKGKTEHLAPLKLFTHVITHEFHHKGQILSLSRHLGYEPIDTDVIR